MKMKWIKLAITRSDFKSNMNFSMTEKQRSKNGSKQNGPCVIIGLASVASYRPATVSLGCLYSPSVRKNNNVSAC